MNAIINGAKTQPILMPAILAPIKEITIAIIFAATNFFTIVAIMVLNVALANTLAITPFSIIAMFFAKRIAMLLEIGIDTATATTLEQIALTALEDACTMLSPIDSSILCTRIAISFFLNTTEIVPFHLSTI